MKVSIEKVSETGNVRVTINFPGGKKPLVLESPQIDMLVQMFNTAKKSAKFKFEMEIDP